MNSTIHPFFSRPLRHAGALALAAGLAACGGGSGSSDSGASPQPPVPPTPTPTKLSGTASLFTSSLASGNVQVRCQGAAVPLTATTSAEGAWEVDTTGQTLPCAIQVSGGNLDPGESIHSVATAFGTANLSPLTGLVAAGAMGKVLDLAWWDSAAAPADVAKLDAAALDKSTAALRTGLGLAALKDIDPRTTVFAAQPDDSMFRVLTSMRFTLGVLDRSFATVVTAAASGNFAAGVDDAFRNLLAKAYRSDSTYTVLIRTRGDQSGAGLRRTGVTRPVSYIEFCNWVVAPDGSHPLALTSFLKVPQGTTAMSVSRCSVSGGGWAQVDVQLTTPQGNQSVLLDYVYLPD
ncbi:MAG: hypothetical protein J0H59_11465 [Comamonadaceae bacterium]|nr:hypothetical protein [Comamonadaceae bacterium]